MKKGKTSSLTQSKDQSPIGFLSYVRDDDRHEHGRLTEFAERLSGEVRMQTGEKFNIFQDRNDIAWGQQWKLRIEHSIDGATFLIPIITPAFFKSPSCCDELERFIEREKRLKRGDLILPVYYVDCPILNDERKRNTNALATVVAERQYADWRELRFEPFTSPQIGKTLAKMATQIVNALERDQSKRKPAADSKARTSMKLGGKPSKITRRTIRSTTATSNERTRIGSEAEQAHIESSGQLAEAERGPVPKTEPPTLVVDALHRGDHSTLTAALRAAEPGHRILVRAGLYQEGVVIDKPVEILGDGELGDVVVEATGKNAILFKASMGRIANLTLRQAGGNFYCVDITQGRLDLEGCDITSQGSACVAIHGAADPRLRRNRIHDGKVSGVFVYENGQGTLEDNEICENGFAGVEIKGESNPTLRRNRIHDGKTVGVLLHTNGHGTLEDNDIFANGLSGVEIRDESHPMLRRNRIHDGKGSGVYVNTSGHGTLEDNDIFANGLAGVEIKSGGNPTFRRNRISENAGSAIYIHDGGGGVFEENDLRENTKGVWNISAECKDKVKRKGNREKESSAD